MYSPVADVGPDQHPPAHTITTTYHHYEETDINHALFYQDGRLMSAPLKALIQHLTPTATYYPDRSYCFAFILSSRLFIPPHELLTRVYEICSSQQDLYALSRASKHHAHHLSTFAFHMAQLLKEWTENFAYDFRSECQMAELHSISQQLILIDHRLRRDLSHTLHTLVQRLTNLEKYEQILSKVNLEAENKRRNSSNFLAIDICDICPEASVLAEQLTHIELERLSNIGAEEYVHSFMKDSESYKSPYEDVKRANNLEFYVQWFNRLSFLVATEICKHSKKKARVKLLDYFIDVSQECMNLGNFNSLMAVVSGLSLGCVSRLKKSWAKVNTAKFHILQHQTDPSSNFHTYRASLKAARWRSDGALESREKIIVPFFSLLLKDISAVCGQCCKRLPNGHMNFDQFWKLANNISNVMTWKNVECPFERRSKVLNYLLTSPVMSEHTLDIESFHCEAAETGYEKDHLKQLKAENHASTSS